MTKISKLIEDFKSQEKNVVNHIRKEGLEALPLYCSLTGIPIIAALYFIKNNIKKYEDSVDVQIKEIVTFYKYEE